MKKSIGFDAIKLSGAKIITITLGIVITMLLSRFRTLEEYGTYSQLLLVISLVTSIFMLGLPNSVNYFLSRAETVEEKQKFLSVYYSLSTILSFLAGLGLVLATPLIVDYFNNPMIKYYMYFLAVYPWNNIIMSSIDNIYIVYKRTTNLMVFRIANSLSTLMVIVIVRLFNWDFNTFLILFIVVQSIFSLSVYVIARNIAGRLSFSFDRKLIMSILKFSVPLGLAAIVGTLTIELDKLVISNFFSTSELAIYVNAAKEMPVSLIAVSVTAVVMPHIVRMLKKGDKKEAMELWGNSALLSYLFICFLAAAFFVFAPEMITLLYSRKYLPGVTVFRIYNIVLLMRCTYFGMMLNSMGKTRKVFYSSIISMIADVILNYLFYFIFGYIGPALSTIVSIFAVAMVQLMWSARYLEVGFGRIFPWKKMGLITLFNVLSGAVVLLLKNVIGLEKLVGEVPESILLGIVWALIYLVIMRKQALKIWRSLS